MNVGIYDTKTDTAAVLPFDEAVQWLKTSDYELKQALKGKHVFPGKIITKAPSTAPVRRPKEGIR